jgi:hypothetical protein
VGGESSVLNLNEDTARLLANWKQNRLSLLERFDLNLDGEVGMTEWALARSAARREVEKQHAAIRQEASTHTMGKPQDGRMFLLANLSPQELVAKYKRWSVFHLGLFFVSGTLCTYLFTHPELGSVSRMGFARITGQSIPGDL